MQQSIFPFIFSLLLTQRLIRFSKVNNHLHYLKLFNYARLIAIFLFAAGLVIPKTFNMQWIWGIFLISCLIFALRQNEMRTLRMFLLAFVPYAAVIFTSNLTEVVAKDFFERTNSYFETATLLSVIWLVAILFSQQLQYKAAEKERLQRQKEDEINRAIAARKVELEELVAERTAELTKQKEELENTLHELRTTQVQLIHSEKMASLGELTAGIAHEIQNPLNFVNNFSEINSELIVELEQEAEKGNLEDVKAIANDVKENEKKILHHGKRADSIVKNMLLHSRGSGGVKQLTDINALCDEFFRLAYHGMRAKDKLFNATMKTEFDPGIQKINVVSQDIGRVILNLISNAFYAVSERQNLNEPGYEPIVTVSTKFIPPSGGQGGPDPPEGSGGSGSSGEICITVKDNGTGIPANVKDKIFQPFFTTKPTGEGTGLGLSLAYDIITKGHGGELKVLTEEGVGTEFTVVLPTK